MALPKPDEMPDVAYRQLTGKRVRHRRGYSFGGGRLTYAVVCDDRFVKIGYCGHIRKRMAAIRTNCPFPVELAGFLVGDKESRIHRALAKRGVVCVRGEWFEYTDAARAVLREFSLITTSAGVAELLA